MAVPPWWSPSGSHTPSASWQPRPSCCRPRPSFFLQPTRRDDNCCSGRKIQPTFWEEAKLKNSWKHISCFQLICWSYANSLFILHQTGTMFPQYVELFYLRNQSNLFVSSVGIFSYLSGSIIQYLLFTIWSSEVRRCERFAQLVLGLQGYHRVQVFCRWGENRPNIDFRLDQHDVVSCLCRRWMQTS